MFDTARRATLLAVSGGITTALLAPGLTTAAVPHPARVPSGPPRVTKVGLPAGCQASMRIDDGRGNVRFLALDSTGWKTSVRERRGLMTGSATTVAVRGLPGDRSADLVLYAKGSAYQSRVDARGQVINRWLGPVAKDVVDAAWAPAVPNGPEAKLLLLTAGGKLSLHPVSRDKLGLRSVGRGTLLTGRGWSRVSSIAGAGYTYVGKRVVKSHLYALTRDGRLLRATVDLTTKRPTLTTATLATGWTSVRSISDGWCSGASKAVVMALHKGGYFRFYVDPKPFDTTLSGVVGHRPKDDLRATRFRWH